MIHAPVLEYAAVRSEIRDLDVIAFEGRGVVSRAIRVVTGGSVTHVGLAAWWGETLMLIESREFRGGRTVRLAREIPAQGVLWYRPRAQLDPQRVQEALHWARGACGAGYSYVGCLRFLRRLGVPARRPEVDRDTDGNRFCSQFVSAAYRMAGRDLRPDLDDAESSPADLLEPPSLWSVARLMHARGDGRTEAG